MSNLNIGDCMGRIEESVNNVATDIARMTEIDEWCDHQLGVLSSAGLSEGELAQHVSLLQQRIGGLAEAFSHVNHALQGAMDVAQLVAQK